MEIGYQFEPINKEEITHTQLVRYAGASGDFNQIHTVVPYAVEAGLGGVIGHGMLIMGFVGQAIGQWFPIDNLAKFSVRFMAMNIPGERISVVGRIVDETEERWICEAKALNEDGEVKVSAAFEVKK
ncbi:MaoC/PaaZ C-terminal domain-containing protein [Peribacillus simplex]|uniref:MaoC/PaaZ C-terminal domain-containing protein n=1 Tax=Peribacillus simplex TaxID=1478 RepID=UPI00367044AC